MAHKESHGALKRASRAGHEAKLRAYGGHTDLPKTKALIRSAVKQHENAEHGGKHETIKLSTGGRAKHNIHRAGRKKAEGGRITLPENDARDKKDNYGSGHIKPEVHADGGRLGPSKPRASHGGKGHGSHVNVIVAPGAIQPPRPMPVPVPIHPPGAAPGPVGALPPRPPMPMGAGPVGMPPGAGGPPPVMPPNMAGAPPIRAAGGRVGRKTGGRLRLTASASNGEGRLEKAKAAAGMGHDLESKPATESTEHFGAAESHEHKKTNETTEHHSVSHRGEHRNYSENLEHKA